MSAKTPRESAALAKRNDEALEPGLKWARAPLFLFLSPVSIFISGAIGTQLKWSLFHLGAWYFWLSILFLLFVHFSQSYGRQLFESWAREESKKALSQLHAQTEELQKQAETLPEVIRTHPDPDFLNRFGVAFEKCSNLVAVLRDKVNKNEASPADVFSVVQNVLLAIARLARAYDGSGETYYGANLMLFATSDKVTSKWPELSEKWRVFCDDVVDISKMRGLLVLADDLKATADDLGDEVPSFSLVVPMEDNAGSDKLWRFLPGAPAAFTRKRYDFTHDTRKLAEWIREESDLSNQIAEEIERYFRTMRSKLSCILSLPIYDPNPAEPDDPTTWESIGVLNLHWTTPRVLNYDSSIDAFSHVLYPFRVLLAELILCMDRDVLITDLIRTPQKKLLADLLHTQG